MTDHPTCETCAAATEHKAKGLLMCRWLSSEKFEFTMRPSFYCSNHSEMRPRQPDEEDGRPDDGGDDAGA